MKRNCLAIFAAAPLLLSCQEHGRGAGEGQLRVLLSAEASITEGLGLGSDVESAHDYAVHFSKYLATVGGITLGRSRDGRSAQLDGVFVLDMLQVGASGAELGVIEGLSAGEWDKFGFETPAASAASQRFPGVAESDFEQMVARGDTYWIEGSVERASAQGGPVSFVIRVAVPSLFHDCERDGEPGVSIVADGSATATITLHGDHMFFNTFLTGAEANIERLAGYIVEADKNGDNQVDNEELAALDATDAFRRARGYSLDGTPILIDNALDFVRAQLATQGHYQGEGECIFDFDEPDTQSGRSRAQAED